MVGYSLNDTIVIFDRVRENMRKNRRDQLVNVLNQSINETLPRSVLTHATALATLMALTIFGGPVIRPFALVMSLFRGLHRHLLIGVHRRTRAADHRNEVARCGRGRASPRLAPRAGLGARWHGPSRPE